MKNWILNAGKLLIAAGIVMTTACKKDDDDNKDTGPGNLLAVAKANSDTKLYAQAIEEAGLQSEINAGNLTLFAPSDDVFEAYLTDLGYSSVESWISVTRADIVEQVLLYHVLDSEEDADGLSSGFYKTLAVNNNEDQLDLYVKGGSAISINGEDIFVVDADIEASNGYMHVVNGMIEPRTVAGLIEANSNFSILVEAADLADGDILATLNNENTTHSILAPNDAAFNVFFGETGASSIQEVAISVGAETLQDILNYHILLGDVRVENFSQGTFNTNLSGSSITINENSSGNYEVADAQGRTASFFATDIAGTNGNIHIISNVMLHYE